MNPILMNNNPMLKKIQGIASMIKGNPSGMINNPQMEEVLRMVNGKNPQEVFYKKCEEMGINPDLILGMLR